MKRFIYIIFAALLMTSCEIEKPELEGSPIYLSVVTEDSEVTRAPYGFTIPNDTEDGILRTAIWATSFREGTAGSYIFNYSNPNPPLNGKNGTGANEGQVAIHATADFDSGYPQLLDQAVYPKAGTPVFFVGFHPQNGWSNESDVKYAEFTYNGSQDVMFAPRREGKYATTGTETLVFDAPQLKFWHLLTWMKIKMVAESEEVLDAWGKVTNIKITSNNQLKVDVSREDDEISSVINTDIVSYYNSASHDGLLPLYATGSDDIFPGSAGYELEYLSPEIKAPVEVAYVLCSPVEAKSTDVVDGVDVEVAEYVLHIETEHRKVQLPIDLRKNASTHYTGSTRAKCFTLNLTFQMGNTIVVTADVDDWKLGGTSNVEV